MTTHISDTFVRSNTTPMKNIRDRKGLLEAKFMIIGMVIMLLLALILATGTYHS